MQCQVCKKEFDEKTGRRPKRFCSNACKVKFWNAEKSTKKTDISVPMEEKNIAKVGFYIPDGSKTTPPKIAWFASNDKKDGQPPPMPTRNEGEDAFDFSARKNEWKKLYNK